MQRVWLTILVLGLGLFPTYGWAQSSPFMGANRGAGPQAATAPTEPAEFELTGVMRLGADPLVCITRVKDQRSFWLKPGQSASGITLVSHDPATHQTVIRHAGRELQLALKERSFDPDKLSVYQPTGPVRSAGLAESVPLTNKEKETEARMLVSDLLEIGMIQRKAYQEAKQQEVAEKRAARQAE
jgi:hypothetical protein